MATRLSAVIATCIIAGILALRLIAGAAAEAKTIGLDAVHGYSTESLGTGTWYGEMRNQLQGFGYTLAILQDFSPQSLAACDAIFVSQARESAQMFSTTDISNIQSYVQSGKGLLAIAEAGYSSNATVFNFNTLIAPYGVTVNSAETSPDGYIVSGFVPHPLTTGVSSVGIDYQRRLISITYPALDLTLGSGESDILAALGGNGSSGNVVIMSDPAPFGHPGDDTNLYQRDNLRLLMNVAAYTTDVPEPATLALLAIAAQTVVRRRK
jgi:hypothetical protein